MRVEAASLSENRRGRQRFRYAAEISLTTMLLSSNRQPWRKGALGYCSILKLIVEFLKAITNFFSTADCGGSGSANGEEKAGKAEGDAGPSCSSLSTKEAADSKSRFFEDSEESEEGEEEGSEEEVRSRKPE